MRYVYGNISRLFKNKPYVLRFFKFNNKTNIFDIQISIEEFNNLRNSDCLIEAYMSKDLRIFERVYVNLDINGNLVVKKNKSY